MPRVETGLWVDQGALTRAIWAWGTMRNPTDVARYLEGQYPGITRQAALAIAREADVARGLGFALKSGLLEGGLDADAIPRALSSPQGRIRVTVDVEWSSGAIDVTTINAAVFYFDGPPTAEEIRERVLEQIRQWMRDYNVPGAEQLVDYDIRAIVVE